MKERIWTEARIRKEFARLDQITGMDSSAAPITFSKARQTMGQYSYSPKAGSSFRFSEVYFEDPTWPEEEAIDTIRHEYAHMLCKIRYHQGGYGPMWVKCCLLVGALPERNYRPGGVREFLASRPHAPAAHRTGERIEHPTFGVGTLEEISEGNKRGTFSFPEAGRRQLGLAWVEQNCKWINVCQGQTERRIL